MFKSMEQIDTSEYSVKEIRELAKDEDVFYMYNTYVYEKNLFEKAGHPERAPKSFDRCWRVRPLSFMVNDDKSDILVEGILMGMHRGFNTVFRMKLA